MENQQNFGIHGRLSSFSWVEEHLTSSLSHFELPLVSRMQQSHKKLPELMKVGVIDGKGETQVESLVSVFIPHFHHILERVEGTGPIWSSDKSQEWHAKPYSQVISPRGGMPNRCS